MKNLEVNPINYRACVRCIMDTTADSQISFSQDGICNHCQRYDRLIDKRVVKGVDGRLKLNQLVDKIKKAGTGKDYDCLIGVSGGVDSTYVAYLVSQLGLRPLAVHFDNGWNSELAVKNIEKVLKKLNIDLITYVVNWEEFRDLQIAFLKSSTPDGEIPTDHAISALLWKESLKHNIPYIISGMNFATESIDVPDWSYGHSDWRYIKNVHQYFGSVQLKTYPHFSYPFLLYTNLLRGTRIVSVLNYVDYDKRQAMDILTQKLNWIYYGGKHHESIYTRFFQGYILPKKFGIDKRYGHLSDLINCGQMSRATALEEIKKPPYPEDLQQQDLEYVVKKLGLSTEEFDRIMTQSIDSFRNYKNSYQFVQFLRKTINLFRGLGLYQM
jgi:N-acetyl sugar amidotransferase